MSQGDRSTRSRPKLSRIKPTQPIDKRQITTRVVVLSIVLVLLFVAAGLLYKSLNQRSSTTTVAIDLPVNPALNPIEAVALGSYLSINRNALSTPHSSDPTQVTFEINPGQSASDIADRLVTQGLIDDSTLFRNYLRYYDLDRQLEAGTYQLAANMTVPEIALALTDATPNEVTIRITEGWRREQIAEYLDQQSNVPFTGAEFLALTAPGVVTPSTLTGILPVGASLEGFLFPDTYRVAINATAGELIEKMLQNFDAKVTPQMRVDAAATGYTLYQILTLASIVEREAVVADERPIIASVYLNRLQQGMKLEADPTVQYAMGFQTETGQWWNLNLTQFDYANVDSPYNTYLYVGLPPGPISNPGLDSISAVIYPQQTPYFFFRAACDGSGRHRFAATFEEHVANECP